MDASETQAVDDAHLLHCPSCGYDLSGLPENRCPECGRDFDPEKLKRRLASAPKPLGVRQFIAWLIFLPTVGCATGTVLLKLGNIKTLLVLLFLISAGIFYACCALAWCCAEGCVFKWLRVKAELVRWLLLLAILPVLLGIELLLFLAECRLVGQLTTIPDY